MKQTIFSRRQMLAGAGLAAMAGASLEAQTQRSTPRSENALNVLDFGATGDGATDDTSAFQSALQAAAAAKHPTVFVPRGQYLIKGNLDVPPNVTLEGIFVAPAARVHDNGSVLLAVAGAGDAGGTPFLMLHTSSTLRGITVFYPEQKMQNPPVAYPWTIRGEGDNICLLDILLVNPYQAVDFGTRPVGRHFIDGLYGQPLFRGLFIDQCFDVGRIANVHFWSFWGGWEGAIYQFMREQAVAFTFARTDWEFISNCFCIGYRIGYHFVANAAGPGNCVLTECGSDIGPNSVRIDASQAHAGHTFVNCQFMAGIEIGANNAGPAKFTACGFWGIPTTDHHALLDGGGHTFFNSCHFITWAKRDPTAAAIHARRGGLTVTACDFMDAGKTQIALESGVDAAIIYGNRFRGKEAVINHAADKTQMAMNVVSGQ